VDCLAGETEVLRKKSALVPICPPQIPHDLTYDRTRADAEGNLRLATGTVPQPSSWS
jgi:hypothetical protein